MTAPATPTSGTRRTVVVVDDHAMFRRGVRAEIEGAVDVVAEAEDVDQAVDVILRLKPRWSCSTYTFPEAAVAR